ncbi:hypothetical protein ABZS66_31400 [Dactylosporangium sp. NPDC005572]|uniref:hypothetical protein n=1 Tax=Dactylosporangium sp. NPDC005572 TaxID=3156889 RepID=UPI0033B4BDA6
MRPVQVGDLLHLKEPDYCYGTGNLTLRVTSEPAALPDPEWVDVTGVEIFWNGQRGTERQVRVRRSALDHARTRNAP